MRGRDTRGELVGDEVDRSSDATWVGLQDRGPRVRGGSPGWRVGRGEGGRERGRSTWCYTQKPNLILLSGLCCPGPSNPRPPVSPQAPRRLGCCLLRSPVDSLLSPNLCHAFIAPYPQPSGMHSGGELTGARSRGRVRRRASVAVLAHAERGGIFQGPAVLWARRAEGPPRGHLVKAWGTGCGKSRLRRRGPLHGSPLPHFPACPMVYLLEL